MTSGDFVIPDAPGVRFTQIPLKSKYHLTSPCHKGRSKVLEFRLCRLRLYTESFDSREGSIG